MVFAGETTVVGQEGSPSTWRAERDLLAWYGCLASVRRRGHWREDRWWWWSFWCSYRYLMSTLRSNARWRLTLTSARGEGACSAFRLLEKHTTTSSVVGWSRWVPDAAPVGPDPCRNSKRLKTHHRPMGRGICLDLVKQERRRLESGQGRQGEGQGEKGPHESLGKACDHEARTMGGQ